LILEYGYSRWLPNKNGLTTTDGVYDGKKKKQIRITDARGKIHGTSEGKDQQSSATMRLDVDEIKI